MSSPVDYKISEETRAKLRKSHLGKKFNDATRRKMSESLKELYKNGYNPILGKRWKNSKETIEKRVEARKKFYDKKGRATLLSERIRKTTEYKRWREAVFARDNWTCQGCKKRGKITLHPHHIKSFAEYPELRFIIGNGVTLCRECHKKTDSYGRKVKNLISKLLLNVVKYIDMEEKFNCKCLKCGKDFISNDSADADGEAFCPSCKEEKKSIAQKVDEQIALRRGNRQPLETVNIYAEARKKRKGTITYMNI